MGIPGVSQALQCFGGYGYCEDFPVEQYYRDMRIHPIHEGTTGIQGIDLLGRKVTMQDGQAYRYFMKEVHQTIAVGKDIDLLASRNQQLEAALTMLDQVTRHLTAKIPKQGAEIFLADATLYLELFGIVTIAWQWLRQAQAAQKALSGKVTRSQKQFYRGKLYTFEYFFSYELPKIKGLADRLRDDRPITVEMHSDYFKD